MSTMKEIKIVNMNQDMYNPEPGRGRIPQIKKAIRAARTVVEL